MNARRSILSTFVAGALALAAAGALAHAGHGNPGGPGAGRGPNPAAVEQRMSDLKAQLQLNEAQAPAWTSYEGAIRRAAEGRKALRDSLQGARGNPDAMADGRVAMLKFNAQSAEEINTARKALVVTLTPQQKATFDQFRAQGMMAGRGHGGSGRGAGSAGCERPGTTGA